MIQKRNNNKASATRQAIINSAEALVTEQGVDSLTLDAVAAECGITVQTIYNRVGGRSAILLAIAEKALADNRHYMSAAYRRAGSVQQRLQAVITGYLRFASEKPYAFRLLANPPQDPQALEKITALIREHNAQLEQLIRDGIDSGSIDPATNPAAAATALWAAANGLLALHWRPDRDAMTAGNLQAVLDTGIRLVMAGLFCMPE